MDDVLYDVRAADLEANLGADMRREELLLRAGLRAGQFELFEAEADAELNMQVAHMWSRFRTSMLMVFALSAFFVLTVSRLPRPPRHTALFPADGPPRIGGVRAGLGEHRVPVNASGAADSRLDELREPSADRAAADGTPLGRNWPHALGRAYDDELMDAGAGAAPNSSALPADAQRDALRRALRHSRAHAGGAWERTFHLVLMAPPLRAILLRQRQARDATPHAGAAFADDWRDEPALDDPFGLFDEPAPRRGPWPRAYGPPRARYYLV